MGSFSRRTVIEGIIFVDRHFHSTYFIWFPDVAVCRCSVLVVSKIDLGVFVASHPFIPFHDIVCQETHATRTRGFWVFVEQIAEVAPGIYCTHQVQLHTYHLLEA